MRVLPEITLLADLIDQNIRARELSKLALDTAPITAPAASASAPPADEIGADREASPP